MLELWRHGCQSIGGRPWLTMTIDAKSVAIQKQSTVRLTMSSLAPLIAMDAIFL